MVELLNSFDFQKENDDALRVPQNIQVIKLYVTDKFFILEPNSSDFNVETRLIIERNSKLMRVESVKQKCQLITQQTAFNFYSAFLGIISLNSQNFMVMAEKVIYHPLFPLYPDFFQIYSVGFIPLTNTDFNTLPKGQEIMESLQNLKWFLSKGYYFTFDGQHCKIDKDKFMWNKNLCKDVYSNDIQGWDILLIQGFVGVYSTYLEGRRISVALVSRRSQICPGTRYYQTGINQNGYVANFVETEQIVQVANLKCSFIQIRGSVPLQWKQVGFFKSLELNQNDEDNQRLIEKHFKHLTSIYDKVFVINLLNSGKQMEKDLIKAYERGMVSLQNENVKYFYYNFDENTSGYNFVAVNEQIKKLSYFIRNFNFDAEDLITKEKLLSQKGSIRTNCLACLDRTNVVQQRIGLLELEFQLYQMGINIQQICGQRALDISDENMPHQIQPFLQGFKRMWADHGDLISHHYVFINKLIYFLNRQEQVQFIQMQKDRVHNHSCKFLGQVLFRLIDSTKPIFLSINDSNQLNSFLVQINSKIKKDRIINRQNKQKKMFIFQQCIIQQELDDTMIKMKLTQNDLDSINLTLDSLDIIQNVKVSNQQSKKLVLLKGNTEGSEQLFLIEETNNLISKIFQLMKQPQVLQYNKEKAQLMYEIGALTIQELEKLIQKNKSQLNEQEIKQLNNLFFSQTNEVTMIYAIERVEINKPAEMIKAQSLPGKGNRNK